MIPFQKPVKFGLITGFALIIYTVLLYVLDVDLFSIAFSLINGLLTLGIMIVMAVLGVNKLRDEDLGKKITYLQAALGTFAILLISMYLNGVFSYLLNGIIDPEYMPNKIDSAIAAYEESNIPEAQMNEIAIKFEEAKDATGNFVKSLWVSPIVSAIIGAIIALFIKKDKTEQIPV